jgi:hypothetical protein
MSAPTWPASSPVAPTAATTTSRLLRSRPRAIRRPGNPAGWPSWRATPAVARSRSPMSDTVAQVPAGGLRRSEAPAVLWRWERSRRPSTGRYGPLLTGVCSRRSERDTMRGRGASEGNRRHRGGGELKGGAGQVQAFPEEDRFSRGRLRPTVLGGTRPPVRLDREVGHATPFRKLDGRDVAAPRSVTRPGRAQRAGRPALPADQQRLGPGSVGCGRHRLRGVGDVGRQVAPCEGQPVLHDPSVDVQRQPREEDQHPDPQLARHAQPLHP